MKKLMIVMLYLALFLVQPARAEIQAAKARVDSPVFDFGTVSQGTKVANEFVIESSPSKPIQKEINQPRSSSSKKNSGCLVTLLSIFFISVFIIISIYLL